MGFLDKAKAAANELAAKADTALASSGLGGPGAAVSPERLLRDLGVVAYLEAAGRPVPEGERERLVAALSALEQAGSLPPSALQTTPQPPAAPAAPAPPAAAASAAPVASAEGAPQPGAVPAAPPAAAAPAATPPAPTAPVAAPPPPSWLRKSEDGSENG